MSTSIGMEGWNTVFASVPLALTFLSILIYAVHVIKWLQRLPSRTDEAVGAADTSHRITVVIPCRDEAKRLPLLLQDLAKQTLPVEVLVVDDHSSDGTRAAAEAEGVTCIDHPGQGKKSALKHAHFRVKTSWMATLDADVRIGNNWAQSMTRIIANCPSERENPVHAILGTVRIKANARSPWQRFQALEYGCMTTWIEGGVHGTELAMGSGANSLYRTDSYPASNLHEDQASGDDAYALLAIKNNKGRIRWNHSAEGYATTKPAKQWSDLWNQRARWASKTGVESDRETKIVGLIIAAVHLGLAISLIGAIVFGGMLGYGFLSAIALKTFIDQKLISTAAHRYELSVKAGDRLLFPWRYAGLVWGAWWYLLRGRVQWKGRRL